MFEARYPGKCNSCDQPVEVGDLCMYDLEEPDKIVHERCVFLPRPKPEKPHKFEGTTLEEMGY